MATNKFYITAGLPTSRSGTLGTGTNKAYITAGIVPAAESGSAPSTGWSGKLYGLSVAKINGLAVSKVIGV